MAETETDVERIRRRMLDLEVRVHTLESIAIRSLTLFTGVLLVLGSVLPTFTDEGAFDPVPLRLLNAPFVIFGSLGENGDHEGFAVAAGIGFLGLLACVVTAVGICFVQWQRWAGPRSVRTAQVVAWLLLIGMLVPVYFTFAAANPELDDVPGPAMWYFVPGVIIFAATALNPHLRQLWSREA
jgi:hypothetical protein